MAYAPYENPKVAGGHCAAGIPGRTSSGINMKIGKRVMDKYFELKIRTGKSAQSQNNQPKDENPEEQEENEIGQGKRRRLKNGKNRKKEILPRQCRGNRSSEAVNQRPAGRTEEET